MFIHNINPVLLSFFGLEIRWYGLMYVFGFVMAYFFLKHLVKLKEVKLSNKDIEDFLFYIMIGMVIGARTFYVLFYNFSFYFEYPLEIFMVWNGGLSFHGGLVGGLVSSYIFSRRKKVNFLTLLDLSAIPFAFALIFGRIGNFINGELVGNVTNVSWCFDFGDSLCRHPSQLYASFKNFLNFSILFSLRNMKFKKGVLFSIFLVNYSALRFIVGFFRAPDVQVGYVLGITLGQWFSIVMFILSMSFMYYCIKR